MGIKKLLKSIWGVLFKNTQIRGGKSEKGMKIKT